MGCPVNSGNHKTIQQSTSRQQRRHVDTHLPPLAGLSLTNAMLPVLDRNVHLHMSWK